MERKIYEQRRSPRTNTFGPDSILIRPCVIAMTLEPRNKGHASFIDKLFGIFTTKESVTDLASSKTYPETAP